MVQSRHRGAGLMDILIFLSEFMVPLTVFYIVGFGILSGRPVFDDFLKGASEGMKTVAGILPTLIGLMAAVGILRESGFLEAAAKALRTPAGWLHIPGSLWGPCGPGPPGIQFCGHGADPGYL